MRILKPMSTSSRLAFAVVLAAVSVLPACSVNVKKDASGQDKKVDIQTPMGGIHVSNDADVRDTGLPVYPGARQKEKEEDGDQKNANVNISSGLFGVKVVAIEYESDDPPSKLIAYYQERLKKYGHVLECHTSKHGGGLNVSVGKHDSEESKAVTCKGDNSGNIVELKVGTEDNQHLVSIESEGKGSDFALVYIQIHGKGTI